MIMKKQARWQIIISLLLTCWPSILYAEECSFGRFACNLRAGVEFSQEEEKFSQANPYVQFVGDTLWGRWNEDIEQTKGGFRYEPLDLHTFIDLTLASIPTKETEQETNTVTGQQEKKEFIASKKSFIGTAGLEWRLFNYPDVGCYTLFVGPIVKGGLQTLTESPDTGNIESKADTVNHFESVGLRIGEHETLESPTENRPLKRYLDITWGYYENLENSRATIEGLLQSNEDTGLFLGFKAIVGEGKDDLRVFTGVNLSFTGLEKMVKGLIPKGLQ